MELPQGELLRFTTAGSVDDGKSTLIGRLLFDSKSIFEDQYEQIEQVSRKQMSEGVNLALLTDGLRAEREQGITIDVAYRYFATPRRKFIIADTPGHVQYTRNMVTGASTANLAVILVDVRNGVSEQTRRHSFIASLLGIPHVVYCINKMDLADFEESAFDEVVAELEEFTSKLKVRDIRYLPISALKGDNVVNRSENMNWYQGPTLLHLLEHIHISGDHNHIDCRFPVQYVIRSHEGEFRDFRGYAGRIDGGVFKPGDEVVVLPSGFETKVKKIYTSGEKEVEEGFAPMSALITLEDDLDVSRGDILVRKNNQPEGEQDIDMMVCWFDQRKLQPRGKYLLRHTTREVRCMVKEIQYKVDINSLHRDLDDLEVSMNDIARVKLRVTQPLFTDSYDQNRATGSVILIDESTFDTVGAGMIR